MVDSSNGHAILGRIGVAAIARTQTVELDQTSGIYFGATTTAGQRPRNVTKNNT
jgi:hypothetical protein